MPTGAAGALPCSSNFPVSWLALPPFLVPRAANSSATLPGLDDALAPGYLPGNASWPQAQEIGRLPFLPVF